MDKENPKPPSPFAPTAAAAMENLRSFLIKCALASIPANSLASPQITSIEMQIRHLLPTTFHTPRHPPYAWMVENAIQQLNEDGGSSEEAISNLILNGHKQLPWAHSALLKHHLKKLTQSNILVQTDEGIYMIATPTTTSKCTSKPIPNSRCTYTYTTSPSPSATCSSSSTSVSSQNFSPKGKGRKRMKKNVRAQCCGRGAKGWHKGRGQARGADPDWEWSCGPAFMENAMGKVFVSQLEGEGETTEAQYLKEDVEATDANILGNNQRKGKGHIVQNSVDVECQSEKGNILIEVDPYEQHRSVRGNECSKRKVRPHKTSVPGKHTSQTGKGRDRTSRKGLHRDEVWKYLKPSESTEIEFFTEEDKQKTKEQSQIKEDLSYQPSVEVCIINDDTMVPEWLACDSLSAAKAMGEQTEGDMLDELIEEVFMELREATKISHEMKEDDEANEGDVGRNQHQVKGSQGPAPANVECQVEPGSMMIEIEAPQEERIIFVD